ncbi:TetR/AcrR family transcriptional regulator [Williamsia sterculiae]|uniref:Transcriptional regulator, TetR family n=1 Tax=Williamsia sterculiae TaxID=1344003 RepID=A0A1N7H6I1_9NOCA|nr:TetR/AcrR family transcriptional regulator [Williamsia sterculiae]SIS20383.1 transcriptional regulator, TetR family [Williamsia sterculiae]
MVTSYRMSPTARRGQLLDTAQQLFTSEPFEDVSMSQIATRAGVTRALVYHYFPTKAELFAAIWSRSHDTLGATVDFDRAGTVRDGLVSTLAAHLDFYERHLPLVLIANRSSIAATPVVREPLDATFATLCTAVLDAASASGTERRLAQTAFLGWIGFVREATLASLVDNTITPAENLDMCVTALDATVGAHVDLRVVPAHPR